MSNAKRLWYPETLVDETLPTGLHSAQAWMDELGPNAPGLIEDNELHFLRCYEEGDTIAFKWCEDHGTVSVSIDETGKLAAPLRCPFTMDLFGEQQFPAFVAPGIPADANYLWDEHSETYGTTVEEFIANYLANYPEELPCTVHMQVATWSDKISFRIGPDGRTLTQIFESQPPITEGNPSC